MLMQKGLFSHKTGKGLLFLLVGLACALPSLGQRKIKEYFLTIREEKVNKSGKWVNSMTINHSIPGPTLHFSYGDSAVIHVKNDMMMESSIHWHGILLPNLMDGVPYLSTPAIEPGTTFTYRFLIHQTGTYWYHSHTMLEEQSGLYGGIVIQPRKKRVKYDHELVLFLSDWTNEQPGHVLNNLKRNSEWYALKKGNEQSIYSAIKHHGLGERILMGEMQMPPMDISDVYYNAFLTNGDSIFHFPDVYPGERIRLRVIDGSSSTFFHLQYGGGKMEVIAADGQNVVPVKVDRMLIGAAETYDVLITIPQKGSVEFRATAQDGSGYTSAYFGTGRLEQAPTLPKPDLFHMSAIMMEGMAGMKMPGMSMQMSASMVKREMPYVKKAYIDREDINIAGALSMNMGGMNMGNMDSSGNMPGMNMDSSGNMPGMNMDSSGNMPGMNMDSSGSMPGMNKDSSGKMPGMNMDSSGSMPGMNMQGMGYSGSDQNSGKGDSVIFNYDMLRSLHPTNFDTLLHPVRHLTFNLTGSMYRYIWSINGKTLSEDDSIQVKQGEVLEITMVNQSMMYHPMHLHGHFFRVLNINGDYSPLKHTVIVPPMRTVTIQFEANAPGDWFFHCHILYHMMSGMARTFQYTSYKRPAVMAKYPFQKAVMDDRKWFFWGNAGVGSNMSELHMMYSNIKNAITLEGDGKVWGSVHPYEATATYERFITNYLRPYVGVVSSNKEEYLKYFKNNGSPIPLQDTRGVIGIKYLLPLLVNSDLRVDTRGHVRFQLDGKTWMLPRIWLTYLWNTDLEYQVGVEGMVSQYLSLTAGYHSDYGWGGGLMVRF
ncbi:MAG: multicopper oxidase domain-containing protein [Chitinophagaceae bacterium]